MTTSTPGSTTTDYVVLDNTTLQGVGPPTTPAQQQQDLELRTSLSDAYAAIESDKTSQSVSALTFEELAQQQITRLTTGPTPNRPGPLQVVQNVLNNITAAVTKIQAQPPESFADPDPTQDVNTPP